MNTFTKILFVAIVLLPPLLWKGTVGEVLAQPSFDWAVHITGTNFLEVRSIALDAGGNSYTTGDFRHTVDFDPGAGIYTLSASFAPVSQAVFVSKLNAAGNLVWAKQMGGAEGNGFIGEGRSIALDDSGNVYTTGLFMNSGDFDPDPVNSYSLTSAGYYDVFVCKLDSAGNFKWAKRMGGTGNDGGWSIALDDRGNVYTTGWFDGTADFDPGGTTYNLVSAAGNSDIFVSKLDAAGNFKWAKAMGGAEANDGDGGFSITLDRSGNVYTTGHFSDYGGGSGTADFDPGVGIVPLSSVGANDIFISKLDSAGNFKWAKAMGGINTDVGVSLAVDSGGNVYTTGFFSDIVDFDPGAGTYTLTSAGLDDIFISKLDSAGNFVWAKRMGGTATDWVYSIAVDNSGNVYTTGYFTNTVDFNPGTGVDSLVAAGVTDMFVSELNASGDFVCAGAIGGIPYGTGHGTAGHGIAVDSCSNIYVTGGFGGTVDFNPGAGRDTLTGNSGDVFVSRLGPGSCTSPVGNCENTDSATVYVYDCGAEWFVPNAFSPNGDDQNDVLYVYGRSDVCLKSFTFRIYDRWGNNVFWTAEVSNASWDGTYKSRELNSGVYVYYLTSVLQTGEITDRRGNISLIR